MAVVKTTQNAAPNRRFVCQTCSKKCFVYRSPSQLKKQRPRFCSLKCLGQAQIGRGNPAYTGGEHVLSIGYAVVLAPSHPNADSRGYVYKHRLVAEKKLGRRLRKGEICHHVNGDKLDNRPSNIRVCRSQKHHLKLHREMKGATS